MFTGIIEQTGTLVGLESRGGVRRITVEAPGLAGRLREGDSLLREIIENGRVMYDAGRM